MKTFIKCKACGFVMETSQLKDVCPACGLPRTVFEPFTKKISTHRERVINQHLHPISVHFPQGFIVIIMVMLILALWVESPLREEFLATAKLSILALPFTILFAFITGLVDGKYRFKKVTTPLLINKIKAGLTFQLLSIIIFALYLINGFSTVNMLVMIILSILALACAIFLGRKGYSMVESVLPG